MIAGIDRSWIMSDTQLLTKQANLSVPAKAYAIANTCGLSLNEIFVKYVYRERNRCAHNTRSYQHNLPSLKGMTADDYKLQNCFLFMAVILLLDGIYIKLFRIYLEKQS
jgi:abortive infection bacteriophage resistance protein